MIRKLTVDLTTAGDYAGQVLEARMTTDEGDVMFVSQQPNPQTAYTVSTTNENGEAVERFIDALKQEDRAECMFFDKKDEKYEFGGIGREWISFEFDFAGVTVEWDEFDGKAWYVRERKQ